MKRDTRNHLQRPLIAPRLLRKSAVSQSRCLVDHFSLNSIPTRPIPRTGESAHQLRSCMGLVVAPRKLSSHGAELAYLVPLGRVRFWADVTETTTLSDDAVPIHSHYFEYLRSRIRIPCLCCFPSRSRPLPAAGGTWASDNTESSIGGAITARHDVVSFEVSSRA